MDDLSRKVLHDLQGPVNLVKGFGGEVVIGLDAVDRLVRDFEAELPADFLQKLRLLLQEDVSECLELLLSATTRQDAFIESLRNANFRVKLDAEIA